MPKLSQDETKNTAAENDEEYIEDDEWWMSYDSGVPAEDITEQLLKAKKRTDRMRWYPLSRQIF
ncbi:hypothetical protein [Rickettsia endosymbiont of Polydrusus tereticollis]|uniref:hypothetical protein n=1 Tax=Rickettsia endosymbiont of Polydrusus tereticollis TaxID=3066251 RepID=UPI003133005F